MPLHAVPADVGITPQNKLFEGVLGLLALTDAGVARRRTLRGQRVTADACTIAASRWKWVYPLISAGGFNPEEQGGGEVTQRAAVLLLSRIGIPATFAPLSRADRLI